ncbi:hypothetical protein VA596_49835 [Amycolatopsis sp., V23-08]|uniref:Phage tail protein n=1 Tax=Amycolatopsis heterodermiae TaxID=3110235 RepID=A0ABU5RN19_9PSEU|nr:phage tail tube protein [Amycolatopsis sp., V23-08]MEA5367712.1 hypothetical protein [Amycolatopsis sp., V23-08]
MASIFKRLSRLWTCEVNTGTDVSPTWVKVKGLTKLGLTIDANEVDTTDFDSEGWEDNDTTFRKWALSIEGFDGFTGPVNAQVDDPGQAWLKAKGLLTGPDAKVSVRIYRTDNSKGYSGLATSNWKGAGGEVKNMEPFNCDLTGSGLLSPFTYTP